MPEPLPEEIDIEAAAALLNAEESPRWIDCRELDEWHICRIPGAELLPLSRFVEEAPRKLADPAQRFIVYCHHGVRSLNATRWLRQRGFGRAQSLRGGIDLWAELIDPEMRRY